MVSQVQRKQPSSVTNDKNHWRALLLLLVITLLAGTAITAFNRMDGNVQRIAVKGDFEYLTQNLVREMILDQLTESYLNLDLGQLKDKLESMPWIYKASIRRAWPYTLQIQIEEESPIARWNDEAFVNQGGEVIFIEQNRKLSSLPQLKGEDAFSADILAVYRDISSQVAAKGLVVRLLEQDSVGSVTVTFSNDVRVLLGRHEKMVRLQRFLAIYQQETVAGLVFDARYSNGVAVTKNTHLSDEGLAQY